MSAWHVRSIREGLRCAVYASACLWVNECIADIFFQGKRTLLDTACMNIVTVIKHSVHWFASRNE